MGADGGTVPKRCELVKEKAKEPRPDANQVLLANWYYCALSKTPLREPVVSDALGKLYNRDTVLEYLLDKSKYGDGDKVCPHITSLKDVTTLRVTPNPSWTEATGDLTLPAPAARFVCPVSLREMNGRQKFAYLAQCGCVLSWQALREVSGGSSECLQCNVPFDGDRDVVLINSPKEEWPKLMDAFDRRKAAAKAARKHKKKPAADKSGPDGAAAEDREGGKPAKRSKKDADRLKEAVAAAVPSDTTEPEQHHQSAALSKAASIIQAYENEKKALGVSQSAAVRSLFTSSLKKSPEKKADDFFNRGTIRQIM